MTSPVQQRLPDGPYSADELADREALIRNAAVAWALQWDGLTANPTGADDEWGRYLNLIAPIENPSLAASMAHMSGCALFARAYLRAVLRITPDVLTRPYVVGHAVSDVHGIAFAAGGVHVPGPIAAAPRPGDIVRVTTPEHVYVVVSVEETADGWAVESIDGGQKSAAGWQMIERKTRTITRKANGWIDHVEGSVGARLVQNVYDLGAMLRAFGVCDEMAPED